MTFDSRLKPVLSKMMRFCSLKERCISEVKAKLFLFNLSENQDNKIIKELIAQNFLNEERYVSEYVYAKHKIKNWGRLKIKNYLSEKKIADNLILNGLQEINKKDYEQTVKKLAEKKLREIMRLKSKLSKNSCKIKVMKYLQSKGYETDLIYTTVNKLI